MLRRAVRFLLTHLAFWLQRRRAVAKIAVRAVRLLPVVERHAIQFVQARGMGMSLNAQAKTDPTWNLDAQPEVHEKWVKLLQ